MKLWNGSEWPISTLVFQNVFTMAEENVENFEALKCLRTTNLRLNFLIFLDHGWRNFWIFKLWYGLVWPTLFSFFGFASIWRGNSRTGNVTNHLIVGKESTHPEKHFKVVGGVRDKFFFVKFLHFPTYLISNEHRYQTRNE